MDDCHALSRFVEAQAPLYSTVQEELRRGRKTSHWMWFVFPQLRGLGRSEAAHYYGIGSRAEAEAYLAHPLLGARLRECTELVLALEGTDARAVFGSPDDLKFRSCMTLFSELGGSDSVFGRALVKYFADGPDQTTLELLRRQTKT